MTDRVKRLYEKEKNRLQYKLCVEKMKICTESFIAHEGMPPIIKRAQACADYMDQRTLFIEDDELLIYNIASKPNGMELSPSVATWRDDDLDAILSEGMVTITEEDRKIARSFDDYYWNKFRSNNEKQSFYYSADRIMPFARSGIIVPPWTPTYNRGGAGCCWGGKLSGCVMTPDYEYQLHIGFEEYVRQAKEKLSVIRIKNDEDIEKVNFLRASIIGLEAAMRMGYRYSELASKMALKCDDLNRKAELEKISEICRRVPAKPARTFREAVQAWLFYFYLLATGALGCGRMDQYLYPYYKNDIESGLLTRDEALEILECLRIKLMQFQVINGGTKQREKWTGMARWNTILLGGVDPETGEDATNDLTYLFLDAAKEVPTLHPMLVISVHEKTPKYLLEKAIELKKSGAEMPVFISDKAYVQCLEDWGISKYDARKFSITGAMELSLPGASRINSVSMFVVPAVFEYTVNNGQNYRTGEQLGPKTGFLRDMKSYEEFYDAFLVQMNYFIDSMMETSSCKVLFNNDSPDVFTDSLSSDSLKVCRDILHRKMKYENCISFNVVGIQNVINSLAGLKKVVFDDRVCTPEEMQKALQSDWRGYDNIRNACIEAPKYGNDIAYVDDIGITLWEDIKKVSEMYKNMWDEPLVCSALPLSSHIVGGELTGATTDGRKAGGILADGSVSPVQGTDSNGLNAVLNSAKKMGKGWSNSFLSLMVSKKSFSLKNSNKKIIEIIRDYLCNGGKILQISIIDKEELKKAVGSRDENELIVQVFGYSAYATELSAKIQKDILSRTVHNI